MLSDSDATPLWVSLGALLVAASSYAATVAMVHLQARVGRRQACLETYKMMEETRADRHRIRSACLRPGEIDWARVPGDLRESFDRVARAYDALGALDRRNILDRRFVKDFFVPPFDRLWTEFRLEDFVAYSIRGRDPTHLWELVQFRERTKRVYQRHPAIRKARSP